MSAKSMLSAGLICFTIVLYPDISIVNRVAVIEQLRATQETIEKLLALLESSEQDRFASHLYRSRREYRSTCERQERAESMGSKATFARGALAASR
jgi:hypothetical protein